MSSQIPISEIDLFDTRYRFLDSISDKSFLSQAIKRTGLINPVLIRPVLDSNPSKKYRIIAGFNRIQACIDNQQQTIQAVVTDPDISETACIIMAINCVAFKRSITQTEMILSVSKLSAFMSVKEIADQSAAIFNTRLNEKFVSNLLQISRLPNSAVDLIKNGQLSIKAAGVLTQYPEEDINAFLDLFANIRASASVQLELLNHIKEISKRDHIKISILIGSETAEQIINTENIDTALKTKQFRSWIYRKRYPALSKARDTANRKIRNLNMGPDVNIHIPETFEDQKLKFSFSADSPEKARELIQKLFQISELGDDFTGLFS